MNPRTEEYSGWCEKFSSFKSGLCQGKEKICELRDKSFVIINSEEQQLQKNKGKNSEESL